MGTSLLWGASWIPLKALHAAGADGVSLVLAGYSILFLVSLPFIVPYRRTLLCNWHYLAAIAVLGGSANLCFSYALIYGEVIRVMVLFYLLPVWGVLGGRFILKEHTSVWRWLGVVLAIGGAFILLGGAAIFQHPPQWIDVVALASGIFFAMSNLLFRGVKTVALAPKLTALFLGASLVSSVSLLLLDLPFAGFSAGFPWHYVLLYSLTWLVVANVGSQWAITQMPAGRSSIILILELITAVFTAAILAGEVLTTQIIVGGLLILTATAAEVLAPAKRT